MDAAPCRQYRASRREARPPKPAPAYRKAGEKVFVSARDLPVRAGGYAEYIAVPVEAAHPLPQGVDLASASCLSNYPTRSPGICCIRPRAEVTGALIDPLAAGCIKPLIHTRLKLAEVHRAHEMLELGEVIGKIVMKP